MHTYTHTHTRTHARTHARTHTFKGTGTFGYLKSDLSNFYDAYCPSCSLASVSFDKDNVWKVLFPSVPSPCRSLYSTPVPSTHNLQQGVSGKNYVEGILDTSYISSMTIDAKTLVSMKPFTRRYIHFSPLAPIRPQLFQVANTNTSASTESSDGFYTLKTSFFSNFQKFSKSVMFSFSLLLKRLALEGPCWHSCKT